MTSSASRHSPDAKDRAWGKFERLLKLSGVSFRDVAREEGAARMNIIRIVNSGSGGGGGATTIISGNRVKASAATPRDVLNASPLAKSRGFFGGGSSSSSSARGMNLVPTPPPPLNAKLDFAGSTTNANDSDASPLTLTPLEIVLVSSRWNKMVPPTGETDAHAFSSSSSAATCYNSNNKNPPSTSSHYGTPTAPFSYTVPTRVRPHERTASEALAKSFHAHVEAGHEAPALSIASELLQRDGEALSRVLQDYLPHITLTQMQEVMCIKPATSATLKF